MRALWTLGLAVMLSGCGVTAEASADFSDAITYLFRTFDGEQAELASAIAVLEEEVYLSMDIDAPGAIDRALAPERLTAEDYVGCDYNPDRNPEDALPLAVAYASRFSLEDHWPLQLEEDHTAWEPYSPDIYVRTFDAGEDCWLDDCERLETTNDVKKTNFLMSVEYTFYKHFRSIDLNAHDPEAPERMGVIARSWYDETFVGDSGGTKLHQGSTIELWIPRDGQGFVRDGTETNVDDGDWDQDSSGGGILRLLGLWSESEFGDLDVDDDTVIATTRAGIDQNFQATDEYLETLPR